ncbi:hypothetical protein HRbin22_00276 [Candidatus Thermoflexus japonica]|uniref:EfeO-type cupredoxin-like domain-containing protein n=1 Tax=Candidatus Thermoflexus japonica TaxID=2035417 RepID=A0A2H5Y3N8_9CHLR|nr:hypothetical protein HRbin22_00276 [Candidatus Thermoflexus japonica]
MKRVFWTLFGPLILGLWLGACAPGGGGPLAVQIAMSEYQFEPNVVRVKAGQEVRLTLVNKGKEAHELMVGRNVVTHEGRPAGFAQDFFEGISVRAERGGKPIDLKELMEEEEEGAHGFMVALEPGEEPVTLIFTVPSDKVGEWEMGCFENDGSHWQLGMQGKWIVQP